MMKTIADRDNGTSELVVTTTAHETAHEAKTTFDEIRATEKPPFSQEKGAISRQTEVANADHVSPATLRVEEPAETWDEKSQYLTGFKLVTVIACMCLACFLMLIDTMVVSTVSCFFEPGPGHRPRPTELETNADIFWTRVFSRLSRESRTNSTRLPMSAGMPPRTSSGGQFPDLLDDAVERYQCQRGEDALMLT
jgi:hypothetical protein